MVITYNADNVALRSTKTSSTAVATVARETREIEVTRIPNGARVLRAVLTFDVSGVGAYGSNFAVCTVNGETFQSGQGGAALSNSLRIELHGNRTVGIEFVYQMSQYVSGTQFTAYWQNLLLTIEFEMGDEPSYIDNEVLVPQFGVDLYDPQETDFTKRGIVLHPSVCTVEEQAAGMWELTMEHPMDAEGRWQTLLEDAIIKAPVPPYKIPETEIPVGKLWRVKTSVASTPLYSQLPYYRRASTPVRQWNVHTEYHSGDHVWDTYNGVQTIFMSGGVNFGAEDRPITGGSWAVVGPLKPTSTDPHGGTGIYNPGVVIRDLASREIVTFMADYSATYIKVRDAFGRTGYIERADAEETQTAPEPYVVPERTIYKQLFRIYRVEGDDATGTVSVSAKHKSYDFEGNGLFDCKLTEAEPATALAMLQGRLMYDDSRLIACPIEHPKISGDWSFGNPIQALLDPDEGFAAQLQAKVLRDNDDFFILPASPSRRGARLAYGVNLRGVTWERSLDELYTRIIPRAQDEENNYLFLDELYVDSPYIADYSVIRIEVLDSKYSVGQEIELADGTKKTLSKSEVIERMRQEAENRYYVDGADKVALSLDVDFVLLGDTEEYRQYRNLERVNLYDMIEIDTRHTTVKAQVIGYEWDCLLGRYNRVSIGKVYSQARRRIPGYRMATGAVTYNKLSPGLIKWIRGAT